MCDSLMTAAIGPVDEDLQKLYNEVWAEFADDPGAHDDLDNIYSVYAAEPDPVPPTVSTIPAAPPPSTGPVTTPPSSARSPIRRLPPTPTTPANLSISPSSPEPYYDAARPGHYSTDSYASTSSSIDMLKRVTTGGSSRKLPQAPVQSFSHYSDRDSLSSIHSQNYDAPHAADYRQAPSNGNFAYPDNYSYPTPPTPPAALGFSRSLSHRPSYESVSESSNNVPGLNYPDRRAGCALLVRLSCPTATDRV